MTQGVGQKNISLVIDLPAESLLSKVLVCFLSSLVFFCFGGLLVLFRLIF